MTEDNASFTAEDAVKAQRELRRALGLGAQEFPLPVFVGMISDEIEQMRDAGRTDADIAAVIHASTGHTLAPETIARFYAPPEMRRPHGE